MLTKLKNRKGFTLIELMIVVAIIAILAAIAIPQYRKFQLKAKAAEGKTNLEAIRVAEESYAAEFDKYVECGWAGNTAEDTTGTSTWTASDGFDSIGFAVKGKCLFVYGVCDGNTVGTPSDGNLVDPTDGTDDITIMAENDNIMSGAYGAAGFYQNDENTTVRRYDTGQHSE